MSQVQIKDTVRMLVDVENSTMSPLSPFFPPLIEDSQENEDINSEDGFGQSHALRKPIFTVLYISSVLFLFLFGIYGISDSAHVEYGIISPISPPIEGLYFSTTSAWPHCEDSRYQWWRLVSHQVMKLLYCF